MLKARSRWASRRARLTAVAAGQLKIRSGTSGTSAPKVKRRKKRTHQHRRKSMAAAKLFRLTLQVSDLDKASAFYSKLLDDEGIRIPRGSRHYYDCGPVILALVDQAAGGLEAKPIPDYVYFAVSNLEEVYERARA